MVYFKIAVLAKWEVCSNGTAKVVDTAFKILPHFIAAQLSQPDVTFEYRYPNETERKPKPPKPGKPSRAGVNPSSGKVEKLRFFRAPGRYNTWSQGAELVSWPPMLYKEKWPYSISIKITVQTVPFQEYPIIHLELGVRRWAGPSVKKLRSGSATTIFLRAKASWIEGISNSLSFGVARAKGRYIDKEIEDEESGEKRKVSIFQVEWLDKLGWLLKDLKLGDRFPDPNEVKQNPRVHLNLSGDDSLGVSAAMVYRHGMKPAHIVASGLMPFDRDNLAKQIEEYLKPRFVFAPSLPKVKYKSNGPVNPYAPSKTKSGENKKPPIDFVARCQAISTATGGQLNLALWHQSDDMPKFLVKALGDLLGLSPRTEPEVDNSYEWQENGLTVRLTTHYLGKLGSELKLDNTVKNRLDRLMGATRQRMAEVAKFQQQADSVSRQARVNGAIVELDGAGNFAENADPITALRLGFANQNWLTQFITPPDTVATTTEEKLSSSSTAEKKSRDNSEDDGETGEIGATGSIEHRMRQSLLDLLRQMGVMIAAPDFQVELANQLPKNSMTKQTKVVATKPVVHYIGLWLIKQQKASSNMQTQQTIPVLVQLTSNSQQVRVKTPWMNDWLPYPEALIAIAKYQIESGGQRFNRDQTIGFVYQSLRSAEFANATTVLFCHAQNMRGFWKYLANGELLPNKVLFGGPVMQVPGLRLVRVRGGDAESPEWYAENDKGERGFSRGLFKMGEQVFASTHDKPKSLKVLSKTLSKAPSGGSDASVAAWNPGLYELTVISPSQEEVANWAVIAHELRKFSVQFDDATALPLPLHLAKKTEEYAQPLKVQAGDEFFQSPVETEVEEAYSEDILEEEEN